MKNAQNNESEKFDKDNIENIEKDNGFLSIKQKSHGDIHFGNDWELLISKHTARYDIWMFLNLYQELTVSQISKYLKQSKSTVSRVLIAMESDGILVSRRGKLKVGKRERIPPKYYRISEKYKKKEDYKKDFMEMPSDPQEIYDFLLSEIQNYRNAIYNVIRLINYLSTSLNYLDNQIEDINKAKDIYKEFFSGINEPEFNFVFLDKKRFKKFYDLRLEYILKLKKLIMEQELDSDSAFVYFDSLLPLKALLKLYKKER